MCWVHGRVVQIRLNQLRCVWGADSCGSKAPCIRWEWGGVSSVNQLGILVDAGGSRRLGRGRVWEGVPIPTGGGFCGRGYAPSPQRKRFFIEMTCFVAFWAVLFVCVLPTKILNFPPEVVIWWTMKMYLWEIVNTATGDSACPVHMQRTNAFARGGGDMRRRRCGLFQITFDTCYSRAWSVTRNSGTVESVAAMRRSKTAECR